MGYNLERLKRQYGVGASKQGYYGTTVTNIYFACKTLLCIVMNYFTIVFLVALNMKK